MAQSQVTNLTTDLAAKAPLASPTFTGTPAAPTAAADTNTTQIATTAFAKGEADAAQAYAIQRANHTGTQDIASVTGVVPAAQGGAGTVSGILKANGSGTVSAAVSNTDFAAATHATRHQSGGADAIKLDDLATPDDNTDLDATTGRHGLLPKLGGGTSNFLRADGTWAAPAGGSGANILWSTGSTTPVIDNSAAETSVASGTIPANTLGTGTSAVVHLQLHGFVLNNSGLGRDFTLRIKYGATTLFDDATSGSLLANSTIGRIVIIDVWLCGDGTTGTQRMWGEIRIGGVTSPTAGYGDIGAAGIMTPRTFGGTSSEDSTADKTLDLTVQLSTANAAYEWTTYRATCFKVV